MFYTNRRSSSNGLAAPVKRVLLMNAAARIAIVVAAALALAASAGGGVPAPSQFAARVDNPWFPLAPGSVYVYQGVEDGKAARDVVTVTHRTKRIQGVACTLVDDRLFLAGKLAERTSDWYAQDRSGSVWYFGEATAEFGKSGRVTSTEGSWQAGRNDAVAGLFMPAHPKLGQTARQEYLKGEAEDRFRVVDLGEPVDTPVTGTRKALVTEEWTPLEPGVLDRKLYARGLGLAAERSVKGGHDHLVLVSFHR
jgi:hypothetical protein